MSSIKYYDPNTSQWRVGAGNIAPTIQILDVNGFYESKTVEGALREIGTKIDDLDYKIDNIECNGDHGGGGGSNGGASMPTITSEWQPNNIDPDTGFNIDIFYSSPNLGDGTCFLLVNNVETSITTVTQGNNTIKVPALGNGIKKVSIYVKDRAGLLSNQLTWTVVSGGIKLTLTTDTTADYKINSRILLTYNIECDLEDPIETIITIDKKEIRINGTKGYNSYEIRNLDIGTHNCTIQAICGNYKTAVQKFTLVVVSTDTLYVTSTFDEEMEYEKGIPVTIPYRVSIANTDYYTVNMYLDDFETPVKTVSVKPGTYYWTIGDVTVGTHNLKIEAYNEDRTQYHSKEMTLKVILPSYNRIECVKGGLVAWFDSTGKTNSDTDRDKWIDKINSHVGTLYNSNFGTNGWLKDTLVLDGTSYVEIDMKPFEDNVTLGFTMDMYYKTTDIGNMEARVIDITDRNEPNAGIYVTPYKASLKTVAHESTVDVVENEYIHLTFMIDRMQKFGKIYVNGVLNEAFVLSDSGQGTQALFESIQSQSKIYLNSVKGERDFGACELKHLRIYERELTDEEVLQNYISCIENLETQQELYNFNYNDNIVPVMYLYGDTSNMTLDNKVEMRVKYVSPNPELYGESFDLPNCKTYWQGTSSLAYVMKNYNIELYDENREAVYYTPFKTGAKENIFCLKCNYMESTNAHNVGLAGFVHNCLYKSKNPAQEKDPKIRHSVAGFPMLLYINDKFEGVYDFNLDRYSTNSYGYNLFDKCLCYEVSANSDTTAGAFVKWTPASGKTEQNYYASDFECIYPSSRRNGNDNFEELKRLIEFVNDADEDYFKEYFDVYFDRESVFRYYIFVMVFGLVDNLGKNMKITTFDGVKWYIQAYDMDTCLGLDNSGALKYDVDIEMETGFFNTSCSNLWTKVSTYYANEILEEYSQMRQSTFTLENMYKYIIDEQIAKIPQRHYNSTTQRKYLDFGSQYLYACHGNRYYHIKRWLKERLLYMDTLLGYTGQTSDYITIRCNKQGLVTMNISTYSPMYLTVKWRDEADGSGIQKLKVPRNESRAFSYTIPTATDQEVIVYAAHYIKSLGDLSDARPSHLLLSNADRITDVICTKNDKLINLQLNNCKMLQTIDLTDCSSLGTISNSEVLDLRTCSSLRYLNLAGTKLTGVNFNASGGNLVETYFPTTLQSLFLQKQYSLKIVGLPYASSYATPKYIKNAAANLTSFTLIDCPNVERITNNTNIDSDKLYDFYNEYVDISSVENLSTYKELLRFGNGLAKCKNIHIENSCINIENMSFRCIEGLTNLTLINLPNLKNLLLGANCTGHDYVGTNDLKGVLNWDNITIRKCDNIESFRLHEFYQDPAWLTFSNPVIDLTKFKNLKNFSCNLTTQGLETIILPDTLESIWIDGTTHETPTVFANQVELSKCNLTNIYFKEDYPELDHIGVDLGDRLLKDVSLGYLPKVKEVKGLNIYNEKVNPIFNNLNCKTYGSTDYPLITPKGRIDISNLKTKFPRYIFCNIDFTKEDLDIVLPEDWDSFIEYAEKTTGLFFGCINPNWDWNFVARFFPKIYNRESLVTTYQRATFKEQNDYDTEGVTLVNSNKISDYIYTDTPFYETNLKYIKSATFNKDSILYATFKKSNLVRIGTVICSESESWLVSEELFADSPLLEEVGEVRMPNTESVNAWFRNCPKLRKVGKLVTGNVVNANSLYSGCVELIDFALPPMQNVRSIDYMFYKCKKIRSVNIEDIGADNNTLTTANYTFEDCSNLVDVSLGTPNFPNTVSSLEGTFRKCSKLSSYPQIPANPSDKCTLYRLFECCDSLTDQVIPTEIPTNISNIAGMFSGCNGLRNVEIKVKADRCNANRMFYGCEGLETINIDFTGSYINNMVELLSGCSNLSDVFIGFPYTLSFNETYQTGSEYYDMLSYCRNLTNVEFNMSRLQGCLVNPYDMFRQSRNLVSLKGLDLSILKLGVILNHPTNMRCLTSESSFEFLTEWEFVGELKHTYYFHNLDSSRISIVLDLLNHLAEVGSAQKIYFSSAIVNNLKENYQEHVIAATQKGWTIIAG